LAGGVRAGGGYGLVLELEGGAGQRAYGGLVAIAVLCHIKM